jgi:hypothetical protein
VGTDLSVHTADDLAWFADNLNNRPRKTLGYMKPSEQLAELIATSAQPASAVTSYGNSDEWRSKCAGS